MGESDSKIIVKCSKEIKPQKIFVQCLSPVNLCTIIEEKLENRLFSDPGFDIYLKKVEQVTLPVRIVYKT